MKHKVALVTVVMISIIFTIILLSGCTTLPKSDHCDGSVFYNDAPGHSFSDEIKWLWDMKTVSWPEEIVDPPRPAPESMVSDGRLRVTYINHATMLIQYNGVNILTDPIWSERAGPLSWLGSKRIRKPGIAMADLPKIDVILISHNHYDHCDIPTLDALIRRDNPLIITGIGVGKIIPCNEHTDLRELDWWQDIRFSASGLTVTCVPAFHNSGRGLFDTDTSLWAGFVISGSSGNIYFAGDSAYGSFVGKIHERWEEFRCAILPIGSYEKRWFMKTQHMNPDDAARIHVELNARKSIGMHFATFLEHPEQTIDQHETDLAAALQERKVGGADFIIPAFGEGIEVP
jgi:L-ascorbate metabolism protein UlaG (beta-lactamase superfamily)